MPSSHTNAGLLIRSGLYDNLHSFVELEKRVSALGNENSKAVGDAFEVFVEGYLATHQKLQVEAYEHTPIRDPERPRAAARISAPEAGWTRRRMVELA
jgi:hypothetical protein